VEALEAGLVRLAAHPALRARLARAVRKRVEREFSLARRMSDSLDSTKAYCPLRSPLLPW